MMPWETLTALIGLALAAAWTPGPNNVLVANSGATFGLRATLPHMAGITIGYPLMIFIVGLGLGQVFQASALLRAVLQYGGAALMLWVAWNIARASELGQGRARTRPFTFLEAAGFQWINPKGWAMAIAITAQFITAETPLANAIVIALVFIGAGLSSSFAWTASGRALQHWLEVPGRLVWFNRTMAAALAGFVLYMLLAG